MIGYYNYLRLSLYQIHYLSRIPDHAAVNEAVNIAKRRGHKGISGAVNGILRSILREGVRSTEEITDDVERLSIETSHPLWMVKRFVSQYGFETTEKMLKENNEPPVQTLRVNLFKRTVEQVLHLLTQEGYVVAQSEIIPECIYLFNGQAAKTTAFQKGFVTIQDESSMIPAYALTSRAWNDSIRYVFCSWWKNNAYCRKNEKHWKTSGNGYSST